MRILAIRRDVEDLVVRRAILSDQYDRAVERRVHLLLQEVNEPAAAGELNERLRDRREIVEIDRAARVPATPRFKVLLLRRLHWSVWTPREAIDCDRNEPDDPLTALQKFAPFFRQ